MNIRFDQKSVLITGGTAGIGLATAELFGGLGARVAVCGTNAEKLRAALSRLEGMGIATFGRTCDVSDADSLASFARETADKFGGLDVWIGNAAVHPHFRLVDTPLDAWEGTVGTNLRSAYVGGRLVKELMGERGGVMLLASSFACLMPSIGNGVYAATKAAIGSVVKTLAAELAPYRIRVNGYVPGFIVTEMNRKNIEEFGDKLLDDIALRRFGEPIEVAWSLAFLASDFASYITGILLEISGGKLCVQHPERAWQTAAAQK